MHGYRRTPRRLSFAIGAAVWLAAFGALIEPMTTLILGGCFYEAGCGSYESIRLALALLATLLGATLVSQLASWLVQRLQQPRAE